MSEWGKYKKEQHREKVVQTVKTLTTRVESVSLLMQTEKRIVDQVLLKTNTVTNGI